MNKKEKKWLLIALALIIVMVVVTIIIIEVTKGNGGGNGPPPPPLKKYKCNKNNCDVSSGPKATDLDTCQMACPSPPGWPKRSTTPIIPPPNCSKWYRSNQCHSLNRVPNYDLFFKKNDSPSTNSNDHELKIYNNFQEDLRWAALGTKDIPSAPGSPLLKEKGTIPAHSFKKIEADDNYHRLIFFPGDNLINEFNNSPVGSIVYFSDKEVILTELNTKQSGWDYDISMINNFSEIPIYMKPRDISGNQLDNQGDCVGSVVYSGIKDNMNLDGCISLTPTGVTPMVNFTLDESGALCQVNNNTNLNDGRFLENYHDWAIQYGNGLFYTWPCDDCSDGPKCQNNNPQGAVPWTPPPVYDKPPTPFPCGMVNQNTQTGTIHAPYLDVVINPECGTWK